jgi:predicted RNA binding protein YcfA (HicA-like mRNA interferase family)
MPMSGKQMRKMFEKAGWVAIRQTGSHLIMKNKDGQIESIPQHKELKKGTEHDLLKRLKKG